MAVVLFTGFLVWRVMEIRDDGWSGMQYSAGVADGMAHKLPQMGRFIPEPGQIIVVAGGTPAARAGMRAGDVVVSIDGILIANTAAIDALAQHARPGTELQYRIRRGETLRDVRLKLISPLRCVPLLAGLTSGFIVAFAFVVISLFVYWTNSRTRSAWVFYWLCNVAAVFFAMEAFRELTTFPFAGIRAMTDPSRSPAVALLYGTYFVLAIFVSSLLLHLALVFPTERRVVREHPRVLRLVHTLMYLPIVATIAAMAVMGMAPSGWPRTAAALALLASGAAAIAVLLRRSDRSWKSLILDRPLLTQIAGSVMAISGLTLLMRIVTTDKIVAGIVMGILFGAAYMLLVLSYAAVTILSLYIGYRDSDSEQKRQVRWPLWGTITALSLATLANTLLPLIALSSDQPPAWLHVAATCARLLYLVIPLSFAFGMLKYRLMDIDVIIKKTLVYSAVTGVVIAAFFLLVAGVGTFVTSSLHIQSQTVTVISTLMLALAFVPLRNRVQRFVDRRFFQRRYEASEAEKLIQQEVLNATDLAPLLRKIAEYVQHVLQTRSVIILTREEDGEHFVASGTFGVPDEATAGLVLEREALAKISRVAPVTTLRLAQDEWARMRRLQTELVVPAMLRGELQGVLLIGSMLSSTFDDDDHAFLEAVAQQVALGIDNLTVTDEARDYERALEIQRALLPRSMPRVDGIDVDAMWKPAKIVGGDYFDVFPLGGSTLAFCIADVAGKGMGAALLMASLQAAVKASASDNLTPDEICAKVRNVVCGTLSGGRFVTFFFAMLDTRRLTLRYVNAGHNPGLLMRRGGEVEWLTTGGPVFARLMQTTPYETGAVQLDEGDALLLYTDGVSESRDPDEEQFGDDRLVDLMRRSHATARTIIRDVVDEVRDFSRGVVHDDVTVLCLRVTKPAITENVPLVAVS